VLLRYVHEMDCPEIAQSLVYVRAPYILALHYARRDCKTGWKPTPLWKEVLDEPDARRTHGLLFSRRWMVH